MKSALAFALILIAGFLFYEVVSGHAVALINAIRIGAPATAPPGSTPPIPNTPGGPQGKPTRIS